MKQGLGFLLAIALMSTETALAVQQSSRIPLVGMIFIGGRGQPHLDSFKQGLRERGYREGRNINLEYRYAEGKQDRLPALAAELVRLKVDVIVTTTSGSARAVRKVTETIPIVMTTGNPLAPGLAASLAKPGGNVTGLNSVMVTDLSGKRVEILKEAFPKFTQITALWSPREDEARLSFEETKGAAQAFSLQFHSIAVPTPGDLDRAFAQMVRADDNALVVILSPLTTLYSKRIADLALTHRLAGMYPTTQFVEEGGLMAYGPLVGDLYRRAAIYVDKILKGAKPADLPVEQPTKFEFSVNLKAAKQMGVTLPPAVLLRADRVIK